ncbi:MAG: ribonuclease P protein component [Bacilli bacterium]|nr:ribonuclease P protein component [Bacilli bacterium]
MKKENIVQKSKDFDRIIKKRNGKSNNYFIINKEENNENKTKFGITFSKNLGNAVTRNKLKRRIKNIIDQNNKIYEKNSTYIIIAKKDAIYLSYKQLEEELINVFNKIKGDNNEK